MGSMFAAAGRIAAGQHGRVSCEQLLEAGIDRATIRRWLADGRLYAVHVGVYALGHDGRTMLADYMAAVLACGAGAVLSHRAAAHLLRLLTTAPPTPEVTVPTTAGRRRRGIVVHRVRELPTLDTSTLHGIPITTAPRVLLDLAPALSARQLTRACHEAWVHHDVSPALVEACIARNPRKPGARKLRGALGDDVTLSALETAFLALLDRHGLPRPRTNVDRAGDKVDCYWPQHELTVELLSYRYHASRHAFEADVARRRRSSHVAYSYGDVLERGTATAAELRARLERR